MTADIHFSPLALTHALPFLPLAQGDIDYQVDRRSEPGLIDELLAEPTTKVVLTRGVHSFPTRRSSDHRKSVV